MRTRRRGRSERLRRRCGSRADRPVPTLEMGRPPIPAPEPGESEGREKKGLCLPRHAIWRSPNGAQARLAVAAPRRQCPRLFENQVFTVMDRPAAQASSVAGGRPRPIRAELAELLKLSWPVVISRLGIMAMGLSDAIVVGRYSATQLGYHALGWAPTSVVVTMAIGLLSGVQVMTARAIGEGRRRDTGAVLRRGLVLQPVDRRDLGGGAGPGRAGVPARHRPGKEPGRRGDPCAAGLLPLAARLCAQRQRHLLDGGPVAGRGPGAWAMWIANAINLALDLILVPGTFGLPALGAMGGAWATTGARTFLAVAMLGYIALMPEARALGRLRQAGAQPRRRGRAAPDRLWGRRLELLRGRGLRQHEHHRRLDRRPGGRGLDHRAQRGRDRLHGPPGPFDGGGGAGRGGPMGRGTPWAWSGRA